RWSGRRRPGPGAPARGRGLHPGGPRFFHPSRRASATSRGMSGPSRRQLLRGLGIGLCAAPFLASLARPRRAAAAGVAKRLVVFFTPNGTVPAHWTPQGGETDFTFAPGSILEPTEAIRDHLTIVAGLDFFGADNHEGGMAAMLTANGGAGHESAG